MSCLLDASGSKAKELLERGGFEGVEERLYIMWPSRLQELLSTFSDKWTLIVDRKRILIDDIDESDPQEVECSS